jgi:hypothetical protein
MRYALNSDIHSRRAAQAIYHLGDLVGYAPWPNEVVVLLRERGTLSVSRVTTTPRRPRITPTAAARPTVTAVKNHSTSSTSGRGRTSPPRPSSF